MTNSSTQAVGQAPIRDEAADADFVAVIVTLAWLLFMLFEVAQPFSAVAVDPVASLESTVRYAGFWTALAAPFIGLLALSGAASWRSRGRFRLPQLQRDTQIPSPLVITLAGLIWVAVSLVVWSEPGPGFTLGLPWLLYTGLLGFGWLACTVREALATWREPRILNAARILAYATPVPLGAIFLYAAVASGVALEMRFELSEDALTRYVEEFDETGEESMPTVQMVGLYQVGPPDRRHGCIRVATNGEMDYYAGFAYCPEGPSPTRPNEEFHPFQGDWWRFEVHH